MLQLPKPVANYFEAENAHDLAKALACFDKDAIVLDTGEDLEMKGIAAIQKWKETVTAKYKLHIEPLDASVHGQNVEVLTEVSGSFDGSPIKFNYKFKLKNDLIVYLSSEPK